MTVVINPEGIQRLLQGPQMQEYLRIKTLNVYENMKEEAANVVGNLRGGEIPDLFAWKVDLGVGEVILQENNFSGGGLTKTGKPKKKESVAKFLARKEQNPKEGEGWLTKALQKAGFAKAGVP